MNIYIRPWRAKDIRACVHILVTTPLWQRYGIARKAAERRFHEGWARGATIFVAVDAAKPVGFVWCEEHGAFARSGYIPLIGVRQEMRGKGVGSALLARAEAHLAFTGDVFLLVSDFNRAAQRFYERHGYTRVGTLADYIVPGVNEFIYRKHL